MRRLALAIVVGLHRDFDCVRLWHIADVPLAPTNVCFRGITDMTRTGRYVGY